MTAADCTKIAVIGAAGRFPGADDLQQYWRLLLEGRAVAADPDPSRSDLWAAMRDPALAAKITTLKGGYLGDVAGFDAEYFGISPREAARLDPQQRLLMEVTHDALEDAGITRADLQSANVGVFVGAGSSDYMMLGACRKHEIDSYHGLGNSHGILSNRLSYHLNLKGPSLTVDTACSSSLTALHVAIHSLQHDDIDLAIVGGVNVIVSPDLTLAFSQAKMLSPSGRCNTFGAHADGYGRAEGVGVVVLRPLRHARMSGQVVRCVIRASAVNQDGRSNGITAPNGLSQVQVIETAIARAGLTPGDIAYVEAHGTGTPLGDAIEFNSLKSVFAKHRDARCWIGSAKANIGHTEAAAGMCGLLKAMLMVEHNLIPPHPVTPPYNELILASGNVLGICDAARPFEPGRRCVGVSSFGFGGSNAHVIVEKHANDAPQAAETGRPVLLPLSSHDRDGLAADARALAEFLQTSPATLPQIAASLSFARDHLKYRTAFAAGDRAELLKLLDGPVGADEPLVTAAGEKPKVAFVFAGQGSQYVDMGRELYLGIEPFRRPFDRCATLIEKRSGISVTDLLYRDPDRDNATLLKNTHLGQLALFCFEYALAQFWICAGIAPSFVIGHSLGELVAHVIAGTLALPDAVALVDERAKLMQAETHDGAMLALFLDVEAASELLRELELPLHIAAVNGRKSVVVSGDRASVSRLAQHLSGRGLSHRALETRHAFHSPFFANASDRLRRFARTLPVNAAAIPVVGNLDGAVLSPPAPDAEYWGEHILRPVQFAKGIDALVAQGVRIFLEIGPDRTLSPLIVRDHGNLRALSSIRRGPDSELSLLRTVGAFYEMGFDIIFEQLSEKAHGKALSLPARRLCRKPYWTAARDASPSPVTAEPRVVQNGNGTRVAAPATARPRNDDPLAVLIARQIAVMKSQLSLLGDP